MTDIDWTLEQIRKANDDHRRRNPDQYEQEPEEACWICGNPLVNGKCRFIKKGYEPPVLEV
jgi:hypothetical protein